VPTDNWQVQFRYISRRLVIEKVQQHEANAGELGLKISADVGPLTLDTEQAAPDYSNPFELAKRATAAVQGLTGSIDGPKTYLRTTLTFLPKTCHIGLGWDDEQRQGWPIAGFFADEDVPGIGRVFVALFGSVQNSHGWREHGAPVGHYTPSDAAGLYVILDAVLEDEDPGISMDPVSQYHERVQSSPTERLAAARLMRVASGRAFLEEPLETLAQVFVCEPSVNIRRPHADPVLTPQEYLSRDPVMGGDPYDLAIIGAPLWVATPDEPTLAAYLARKQNERHLAGNSADVPTPDMSPRRRLLDRMRRRGDSAV
jgi:hypothetical protein